MMYQDRKQQKEQKDNKQHAQSIQQLNLLQNSQQNQSYRIIRIDNSKLLNGDSQQVDTSALLATQSSMNHQISNPSLEQKTQDKGINDHYNSQLKEIKNPSKNVNESRESQSYKQRALINISLDELSWSYRFLYRIVMKFQDVFMRLNKYPKQINLGIKDHNTPLTEDEDKILEDVREYIEPQAEWAREVYGDKYFYQKKKALKTQIKNISSSFDKMLSLDMDNAIFFIDELSQQKKIDYPTLAQLAIYLNCKKALESQQVQFNFVLLIIGQSLPKSFEKYYKKMFQKFSVTIIHILDVEEKHFQNSQILQANQQKKQQTQLNAFGSCSSISENEQTLNNQTIFNNQSNRLNSIQPINNQYQSQPIQNNENTPKYAQNFKVYNIYLRDKDIENIKVSSAEFIHLMERQIFPFLRNIKIDLIVFEYDFSFIQDVSQKVILKPYVLAYIIQKLKEISKERLLISYILRQLKTSIDCLIQEINEVSNLHDIKNSIKQKALTKSLKTQNQQQNIKIHYEYSLQIQESIKKTLFALGQQINYSKYIQQKQSNFNFHPSIQFTKYIKLQSSQFLRSPFYLLKDYSKIARLRFFYLNNSLNPNFQNGKELSSKQNEDTSIIKKQENQKQSSKQNNQVDKMHNNIIYNGNIKAPQNNQIQQPHQKNNNNNYIDQTLINNHTEITDKQIIDRINCNQNNMGNNYYNNTFATQNKNQQNLLDTLQNNQLISIEDNICEGNFQFKQQQFNGTNENDYNYPCGKLNIEDNSELIKGFCLSPYNQQLQSSQDFKFEINKKNKKINEQFKIGNLNDNQFDNLIVPNGQFPYQQNNNFSVYSGETKLLEKTDDSFQNNQQIPFNVATARMRANGIIMNHNQMQQNYLFQMNQQLNQNNQLDENIQNQQLELLQVNNLSLSNINQGQASLFEKTADSFINNLQIPFNGTTINQILEEDNQVKQGSVLDDKSNLIFMKKEVSDSYNLEQNLTIYQRLMRKIPIQQLAKKCTFGSDNFFELQEEQKKLLVINQIKQKKAEYKLKDSVYHILWKKSCRLEIANPSKDFNLKIFYYDEQSQYLVNYEKNPKQTENIYETKMIIYFFNIRSKNQYNNYVLQQITSFHDTEQKFNIFKLKYQTQTIPFKKISDADSKINEEKHLQEQLSNAQHTIKVNKEKIQILERNNFTNSQLLKQFDSDLNNSSCYDKQNSQQNQDSSLSANTNNNSTKIVTKTEERRVQAVINNYKKVIAEMDKKIIDLGKKIQEIQTEIKGTKQQDQNDPNKINIIQGIQEKNIDLQSLCIIESALVETEEFIFKFFGRALNIRLIEGTVLKQEIKLIMKMNKFDSDKNNNLSIEIVDPEFNYEQYKAMMNEIKLLQQQQSQQNNKAQDNSSTFNNSKMNGGNQRILDETQIKINQQHFQKKFFRGRFGASGFYFNDKIYIFNGYSQQFMEETSMFVFVPSKKSDNQIAEQKDMEDNREKQHTVTTDNQEQISLLFYYIMKVSIGKTSIKGGYGTFMIPLFKSELLVKWIENLKQLKEYKNLESKNMKLISLKQMNELQKNVKNLLLFSFDSFDCLCDLKKQFLKIQVFNHVQKQVVIEKKVSLESIFASNQQFISNQQLILNAIEFFDQQFQNIINVANRNNNINESYYEFNNELYYTFSVENFRSSSAFIQLQINISLICKYFQEQPKSPLSQLENSLNILIVKP